MVVLRDSRINGEASYTSSCRTSPTSREIVDGGLNVENQIATKGVAATWRCSGVCGHNADMRLFLSCGN